MSKGEISFDLKSFYKEAFGTSPNIAIPVIPNRLSEKISINRNDKKLDLKEKARFEYDSTQQLFDKKQEANNKYSKLGTPFYEKVEGDVLGREFFLPVTLGGLKLPYSVVRISCKKTIVETALVNRKGTVKELINTEDYSIKIRGFLISDNNELPDADIADLKDLFEKDESVVLRNALTDIFLTGEDKVVIKSIDFPEVKGVKHVRPFELDLVSDSEFTLIVE